MVTARYCDSFDFAGRYNLNFSTAKLAGAELSAHAHGNTVCLIFCGKPVFTMWKYSLLIFGGKPAFATCKYSLLIFRRETSLYRVKIQFA